ncbi:MAG: hypothetical protein JO250_06070 [Armatimonadetes bacterium]|nr:hypothetical protein [Armatimonadota bacterium]
MNSLYVIAPYKYEGLWVFDDERVGLVQEPFVGGADAIIDRLVAGLPQAHQGFRLIFSAEPFPGYTLKFDWVRPELGGNVYRAADLNMEGWLCPALFKYFAQAPPELYVRIEAKAVQHP